MRQIHVRGTAPLQATSTLYFSKTNLSWVSKSFSSFIRNDRFEGERVEVETCPKLSIACRRRLEHAPARRPLRTPGTDPAAADPEWGATSRQRPGGRPMGGRGRATSANHVTLGQLDSNGHLLKTVTSNMAAGGDGCAQ